MTRFEEVTRLRELEKKAMHAPWTIKTPEQRGLLGNILDVGEVAP